jgi:undecaprenyl diphosphate synthase
MPQPKSTLPQHVAIIMDGNRRWAKQNKLKALQGHSYVVDHCIEPLVDRCIELGIPYLTLWAFSTENWNRDQEEVAGLMSVFRRAFQKKAEDLYKKGVQLNILGDIHAFPKDIAAQAQEWVKISKQNTKITVSFALNYGGRQEIIHAANKLLATSHQMPVTEEVFEKNLFTHGLPDPDLLIRPGGEKRLSGFLPWQTVYTELYFTDILMPDFTPEELDKALEEYEKRQRRFGR